MKRSFPKLSNSKSKKPLSSTENLNFTTSKSPRSFLRNGTNKENKVIEPKLKKPCHLPKKPSRCYTASTHSVKTLRSLQHPSGNPHKRSNPRPSPVREPELGSKRSSLVDLREPSDEAVSRASYSITKEQ